MSLNTSVTDMALGNKGNSEVFGDNEQTLEGLLGFITI
jgi:hypothetical protein